MIPPAEVAPFRPAAWLPGRHAQTIWPLLIKGPLPRYRRERWTTSDDDFIDLDWVAGEAGAPCVAPRRITSSMATIGMS